MGEKELVSFHTVMAGQEPPGKALLNGVHTIAGSRLRTLHHQAVHMFEQALFQCSAALKFLFQALCFNTMTGTGDLNKRSPWNGACSQQDGKADHALVTNHPDLNAVAG